MEVPELSVVLVVHTMLSTVMLFWQGMGLTTCPSEVSGGISIMWTFPGITIFEIVLLMKRFCRFPCAIHRSPHPAVPRGLRTIRPDHMPSRVHLSGIGARTTTSFSRPGSVVGMTQAARLKEWNIESTFADPLL